ncbi:hypothetical protein K1719_007037 [Acacia pycnantha]|nr:hypothetical protein K1719_007037 [Acacia pycnantha]
MKGRLENAMVPFVAQEGEWEKVRKVDNKTREEVANEWRKQEMDMNVRLENVTQNNRKGHVGMSRSKEDAEGSIEVVKRDVKLVQREHLKELDPNVILNVRGD